MSRANEPAFPVADTYTDPSDDLVRTDVIGGLTIREHFAAMAMQGILSCADRTTFGVEVNGVKLQRSDAYATVAVKFADTLIAELAKAKP